MREDRVVKINLYSSKGECAYTTCCILFADMFESVKIHMYHCAPILEIPGADCRVYLLR